MPKLTEFVMSPNESIAMAIDLATEFLASGETVAAYTVTLETSGGSDISETNLSGDASESSGVVTSPLVTGLTLNGDYKLRFSVTVGSNVYDYWIGIRCRAA